MPTENISVSRFDRPSGAPFMRLVFVTFPRLASFSGQPACCSHTVIADHPDIRSHSQPYVVEDRSSPVQSVAEPLSDHELMLAVRDGELDALGELFERHHGPLYGFLTKLTGHRTVAEDIAQIVFQRMLKYRHTYRDDGSFTAWMYHLARRCASDHFRKASTAPTATDPQDLNAHADTAPNAGDRAATRDEHALLHIALGRLRHDDREVLLLSRFQELSFAEVANILECSAGAAKVRAHRALRELRDIFLSLQREGRA
jgi:RNA polymerase sigma factor (sigma-70 family)